MRTIQAKPITNEAFAPFGQFYPMNEPTGYALSGEIHRFYPDRLTASSAHNVGYSPLVVLKPERMIITAVEYHTTTWEMILPLDDDMILHVAPASGGTPVPELTQVFWVPARTLVKINAAIWHLAPLPATKQSLTAMIILPVCTYANDCTVVSLDEDQYFEIVK